MDLNDLLIEILQFRDARDWKQFHTPKNVAAALSIETGELQELMLWKTDSEVHDFLRSVKGKKRFEEEIADVLIYALLLCSEGDIDPVHAILYKLAQNSKKYPVDLSKGNAVKYSERRGSENRNREGANEELAERSAAPVQNSLFPQGPIV